ncbi:lipopolysaccharide cholinephosphotransferase licD [Streptococcus pneumoniae 5185-06]|nr:lipopolysaccharide cholinephosphotransferase licD [Streptococcus pneumoniae GA16833]EHE59258.1 lipopolysaccharide cholinephosphotransferase licD [Streptococcus pneumoniae 5185-06]EHZ03533.1 licD family protein [Streptococcus pneumoniae GA13499]EHZ21928.1 licD family protein [Streptococcus pneumoniae GA13723]
MKQLTVEDAKQIELEILDYIDTLCKKHNINYIINYGTLIGAVRHEGFIPWDDDIDLSMPREDYQRFINIFQKEKASISSYP